MGVAQGPGLASPAQREALAYVCCTYRGTDIHAPDFLATVDLHPDSDTYGRVIHRTNMPYVGDELQYVGTADPAVGGGRLVVTGLASSRIHVLQVAVDPRRPEIERVIEPAVLQRQSGYTGPHAVHGLQGGIVLVGMLGSRRGEAPGGFAVLDGQTWDVLGRWEEDKGNQQLMGDSWCQPTAGVLFSSEWATPSVFESGLRAGDVGAGRYGRRLHVWDIRDRRLLQSLDLGEDGCASLAVRALHDPAAGSGYVAAALSGALWYWHPGAAGGFVCERVATTARRAPRGWPVPVPALTTDQVISMDDRYLYVSDWLHGDIRQYDIADPARPRLHSRVSVGGLRRAVVHRGRQLTGGPQSLQLSLDGRRLYVTNSLWSAWDNQFYPGLESWMLKVEVDAEGDGQMRLDADFLVDFTDGPHGPVRARAMCLQGGDATTVASG